MTLFCVNLFQDKTISKKVSSFPKIVDFVHFVRYPYPLCLLAPNPIRLLLVCKLKNARKSAFFLLNPKKCCNFATQS